MIKTTCGLDCPDACGITTSTETFPKLTADKEHPTSNGALCALLNKHLFEAPRITVAKVKGKEVSLKSAIKATADALKSDKKLLWRGSGNFGVMQEITNLLFEKIDGTTTKGTLCDGSGDAGILEGRGVNRILPPEQIAKAEVVVVWGKNITVTASHLMPHIKGKKLIVIDPIKTPIAKQADIYLQITPRSDFYIATLLSRFAIMGDHEDKKFLEAFDLDIEEFYDFTKEFRIRPILEHIGTDLNEMGEVLEMITGKKTVFLIGNGVQKYSNGHHVLHAIDSLAITLGKIAKEGCGVAFLGNSKLGFTNPFAIQGKKVQKATTNFSAFDTVLIQGGNPIASMPNSARVIEELKKSKTVIYFGLYENETSKMADIIIPAQNFFEKEDIRLSYAHHMVSPMRTVNACPYGISEYSFTNTLLQALGFDALKEEQYYLDFWLNQCEKIGDYYRSPAYQAIPYADGFGEDEEDEFEFMEEYSDDFIKTKQFTRARKKSKKKSVISDYWLLSPKASNALNTQFKRDNRAILHPSLGFKDESSITLCSAYGEYKFIVKNSKEMREDSILIYANTIGVNFLTPDIISEEGESACYQEVKISIKSDPVDVD
jgi:anaerobic selenocysteine-containing dehydrogenase